MHKRKWWILFVMISLLAALLAACSDKNGDGNIDIGGDAIEPVDEGTVPDVVINDMAFTPNSIDVEVGSTVTWFNDDDQAHTVTSGAAGTPDGYFNSGNIDANGSFSFTFDQTGTYTYFCSLHPIMTGTVNVTTADEGGVDINSNELETAIPGG